MGQSCLLGFRASGHDLLEELATITCLKECLVTIRRSRLSLDALLLKNLVVKLVIAAALLA